ncbi:MAG: dihydroneopterin aldolase [Dehalococcoidia bacterium]|nr:dihydroneopterin aldolase [Dehalococcoidia bacterium]
MAEDRIHLKGMVFYGHHGVTPEEQALGQRIEVDLEVEADLETAALEDDPEQTIDYGALYRITREVVEGDPVRLLETIAQRVADRIQDEYEVGAVWVKVMKPGAPIDGSVLGYAAVEILRGEEDEEEEDEEEDEYEEGPG